MARKNATPKVHCLTVPPQLADAHYLHTVLERDPVFQVNMRCTIRRALQKKINHDQFRSIRRGLMHLALYRHLRKLKFPVAVLPRLEAML